MPVEQLLALVAGSLVGLAASAPVPTFPAQYYVRGTISLPYGNITEPFMTKYDGKNNVQVRAQRLRGSWFRVCPSREFFSPVGRTSMCRRLGGAGQVLVLPRVCARALCSV